MDTFGKLMFHGPVLSEQEKRGSAATYSRMAERPGPDALSADEIDFIESRDSFYLGTVSSTGWPYVQHRGGPPGFLRVVGPATLALAEYRGNRQFVSTGHIAADDRVSLFLMDYPRRARLKILGHARIIEASDDPALAARLTAGGAPPAERVMTIDVAAFDWNCPKYITPRFTEGEIAALIGPRLAALEEENRALKERVAGLERGV